MAVATYKLNGKGEPMHTKETQQAYIAGLIGTDESQVKAAVPQWTRLMKEGVLVRLHIGRWRAKAGLSWSDLGIVLNGKDEDQRLREIVALGHKKLLPYSLMKRLDAAESAARKWLEKCSFRTHWGFFVPVTAYEEWREENEQLRREYMALRSEIVLNYSQIIDEVLSDYRLAAEGAYERLKALNPKATSNFLDAQDFAAQFVSQIESLIPSPAQIQESFYFSSELLYIPLPSLMAGEQAEAERIELEAKKERERIEAEIQANWSAAQWKERLMREMNEDVIRQARAQKETLIDGFLKDVVVQLRSMVYKASTDVLGAIAQNDSLPPRSVVQLKNMVSQVKKLNFYGDDEIEQMLKPVQRLLNQKAEDRDLAGIEAKLLDIATVVRVSLMELEAQPRTAREVGISDEIEDAELRQARQRLGLDAEDFTPQLELVRQPRTL